MTSTEKSENGLNKRETQFAQTSYILIYPFKKLALHSVALCLVNMINYSEPKSYSGKSSCAMQLSNLQCLHGRRIL